MPLKSGTKMGPYDILSPLGAGGMGEVYRARDSRIGRDVALKILPAIYSADSERMVRFEEEARATGALNHPNILAIYDVGKEGDVSYLVSELLEGETLREKLRPGLLPQRKAIEYAVQIAHGLAAAHDKGIIHRDLKPENLFVTKEGRVKILDFGLAKILRNDPGDVNPESETAAPRSRPGAVLGTMGYMSPEQVRGKPADYRSDIFTFGAILFEMLTSKRAFHGDTAADTMSAILQTDPPELVDSNPDLPPAINRIIRHCLEKNPEERFQSAHDVAFYLEALSGLSLSSQAIPLAPGQRKLSARVQRILIAVLGSAAVIFAALYLKQILSPSRTIRFSLAAPDLAAQTVIEFALSPQGDRLAYVGSDQDGKTVIRLRSLDQLAPRFLPGTEDAQYPFWSPDGRFLGFFAEGKLKKIDVDGETVQTVADAPAGRGGSWSRDGIILFAPDKYGGLSQVSAQGGTISPATEDRSKDGVTYRWPAFLPDGRHFLYTAVMKVEDENSGIFIRELGSDKKALLVRTGSNAQFIAPDTMVYVLDGKLMAQKLDIKGMRAEGDPVVMAQERIVNDFARSFSAFSVSQAHVLTYQSDNATPSILLWLDRSGKQIGVVGEPGFYTSPRLAPDGSRIAMINHGSHTVKGDIWLYDLGRNNMTRFTFTNGLYAKPVWFPDGSRIAYGSHDLFMKPSNGAGPEEMILRSSPGVWATDVSPDNNLILFELDSQNTQFDLWILPLSERKPYPYLQTPYNEIWGQFSPDGKWIAYYSDDSGRYEVYVRPYPDANAGKWQVSIGGGVVPKWRRDGKELFYLAEDGRLTAIPIAGGNSFSFGRPVPLFPIRSGYYVDDSLYDVSVDGQRFLVSSPLGERAPSTITVTLNSR